MRAILSTVFGLVSAAMGLMIALPTMSYRSVFWVVQMLLGEFAWIPGLLGAGAVGIGASSRRKASWGIALGAFGLGLSMLPFLQMRRAAELSDRDMRRALGEDYERRLPPIMRARITQRRWSLEATLGMRQFTNGRVRVDHNVVYASTPQRPLMLDVYRPQSHPAHGDRYPAIIVIHGGAWRFGDKGEVFIPHHRYLASLGYVVFDIQYRLSHECKWPTMHHDVCTAVDWVQRYAAAYQVDPARVALLGRSAGGHLALLAAYRRSTAQDAPNHQRWPLAGVVALYAPTDLRMWPPLEDSEVNWMMDGTPQQRPADYIDASPVEHARSGLPPTLIVQGYRDDLVMPAHAELLHNKLSSTDTPSVTVRVPWARHGFDAFLSGMGSQMIQYDIDRFLAWCLYREDEAADEQ
jgi:acetyl esterase/lipase